MTKQMMLTAAGVVSALAGTATAQVAACYVETPVPTGGIVQLTITLDWVEMPSSALGFAGWNIAVEVDPLYGQVVGASYLTAAAPLIDQNNPFGGDPSPDVSGNTVQLSEGLNAFSPVQAFHTGGVLAVIEVDTSSAMPPGGVWMPAVTRKGDSPLGAFTYATSAGVPFSYLGVDFEDGEYGGTVFVPAPGSAAVLAIGGVLGARRRRV